MTKEYPSTKSEKTGILAGKQAGALVIRISGFIRIWVFRNSSFALRPADGSDVALLAAECKFLEF